LVVWSTGTMRNNPFGGGGVPNGLESMAGPMLCCVLCCMCIFLTIVIAYFVWAIITIFDTAEAYSVECSENSNIWLFSMSFVIVAPVIACAVSIVQHFVRRTDDSGYTQIVVGVIPTCVTLVLAVWGVMLWANMTTECHLFYEKMFPNLLLLFKISVILGLISFVGFICVICVIGGAFFLGMAQMSSGTGAGYNDIPDMYDDNGVPSNGNGGKANQTEDYV